MALGFLEEITRTPPADPFSSGIKLAQNIQNLRTSRAKLPFVGPQAKATLGLTEAEAEQKAALAKDPLGGQILPGPAGQVQGLEKLKAKFGITSPTYQQALGAFNATVKLQNARSDYYEANHWLKNVPVINKTQMYAQFQSDQAQRQQQGVPVQTFGDWYQTKGKNLVPQNQRVSGTDTSASNRLPLTSEEEGVNVTGAPHAENEAPVIHTVAQQVPPETQVTPEEVKLKPEDFASETAQTRANIQKLSSDPQTRQKALNFQTINQIIGGVDPSMLSFYAGPVGLKNIAEDRSASLAGAVIPRFQKYNSFVTEVVPTLADKIRQAYGTSITPEIFNILKRVSNPINWKDNPSLAIANWNKLKQLMSEQGGIYNRALGAPISTQAAPGVLQPKTSAVQLTNTQLLQIARGQ